MARNARHHLPEGIYEGSDTAPRHVTKQEFARRLSKLMLDRGWTQSDMSRESDIARDSISCYVRGRSLPEAPNLKKLADALDMKPSDLLPNVLENAIDNDTPSFEMREAAGHQGQVWLRLSRFVTFRQALAIGAILDGGGNDKEVAALVKRIRLAHREEQEELEGM